MSENKRNRVREVQINADRVIINANEVIVEGGKRGHAGGVEGVWYPRRNAGAAAGKTHSESPNDVAGAESSEKPTGRMHDFEIDIRDLLGLGNMQNMNHTNTESHGNKRDFFGRVAEAGGRRNHQKEESSSSSSSSSSRHHHIENTAGINQDTDKAVGTENKHSNWERFWF